ncbi:MAG: DUF4249 family protein [Ferruginibacter sp.]
MNKILLVLCVLVFSSCEKNIDFKLETPAKVLVVDAEIENGKPPTVVLTKSFSFFSQIDPSLFDSLFVHNADVYISNGILTHKLKEYNFSLVPGYFAYTYSIDSSSLSTAFLGELNTNYTLRIVSEGQEYNASTSIPGLNTVPDSFYFKVAPMNPDTNKRVMLLKATDPHGLGNCVRYFTKTNSEPFYPGWSSVYDDQIIDGTTYEVQLPGGVDKNNEPKIDSTFFNKGDTVTLKFCNINRATYNFWSTWEFAFQSIGNPFAQPNKVVGNISNGALGAFCGYAAWYGTKIAE